MDNIRSLEKFFKGKKVLVTGHTGFKGSWLTEILTLWGAQVSGLALEPETNPNLFDILGLKEKIHHHIADIRNAENVEKVFSLEKPEIVIHLAAQAIVKKSYEVPLYTVSTNTLGTTHILEAIRKTDSIKSAVLITTDKVYRNNEWVYPYRETDELGGKDIYSASKAAADIIIASYIKSFFSPAEKSQKKLVATARAGNVIGGGDWSDFRLIPDLIRSVFEKKEELVIRNPKAIRPWEHVLEPLSGYLLLAKELYEGKSEFATPWNFGPNDESFIDAESLVKRGLDFLGRGSYRKESDISNQESTLLKLDISKAKSVLRWSPRLNLSENLKFTFEWYKKFYEKGDIVGFTELQIKDFFSRA